MADNLHIPNMPSAVAHLAHGDHLPFSRPPTPHPHPLQIGFYGLGAMGYLMARNLAKARAGHLIGSPPLLVYNRTVAKCEKLAKELGGESKVRVAQSVADLVNECDVVITNLANDAAVKSVYEEFGKALSAAPPTRNKIFVETSTIYPTVAGELDQAISTHPHSHFITSPVFGAPPAADKAELIIIMSGDYRSKKELAYILVPAVGKKVVDLGGNVEKAPTFKLIGNSMILGCMEVVAEGQTLSEKAGIGADEVHKLVQDLLPAPPMVNYGAKMIADSFDGSKGFAIDGGIKDATHIRRLTVEHNSPMPVIDAAMGHLLTARAMHASQVAQGTARFETLDWSALVAGTRVAAGLNGFDSDTHSRVVKDD